MKKKRMKLMNKKVLSTKLRAYITIRGSALNFFNGFEFLKLLCSRFLVVFEGPGGLKLLRESCRIDFHDSSYLADFIVPSYKEQQFDLTL